MFFDRAVEMVMNRIAAKVKQQGTAGTANSKSTSYAFAAQEDRIPELAQEEAVELRREIEERLVRSGKHGLPPKHFESEQRT